MGLRTRLADLRRMNVQPLWVASGVCALFLCGCDAPSSETKIINTAAEPVPVSVVGAPAANASGPQRVEVTNFPGRMEVKLPPFLHKGEVIEIITDDPNGLIGGAGTGAILHLYYIMAVQGSWIQVMPKGGALNGMSREWIPANAVWINAATFPGVYRDLGSG
jgi:hypothetical protein